ncbi:unnamed protein product [Mytilus coruscus]|uniref:Uncharacterized protein n=1 Tax=Mytilus coruscus TaxID=42192 RepID=A0A6J8AGV0_MYTCO|nr:unnamed protein product [Mytilus coruscus]
MQGRISTRQQPYNTRRCRDVYQPDNNRTIQKRGARAYINETESRHAKKKEMQGRISTRQQPDNTKKEMQGRISTDNVQTIQGYAVAYINETACTHYKKEMQGVYQRDNIQTIQGDAWYTSTRQQQRQYKKKIPRGVYQRDSNQTIQKEMEGAYINETAPRIQRRYGRINRQQSDNTRRCG